MAPSRPAICLIKGFEDMVGDSAIKAIKALSRADDVLLVLHYEQAHQNRKGVSTAV